MFSKLAAAQTSRVISTRAFSSQVPYALSSIGVNRFDDHVLKASVSEETYKHFHETLAAGTNMEKKAANEVAKAMQDWAMERGASNFAHWFSPVRGAAGVKNDAFIDYDFGGEGQYDGTVKDTVLDFSASKLFMGETDGSSFPNGGMRQTHRAAAFLSWDRMSPPFVRGTTMFIPSAFVTHNGDALDDKTPTCFDLSVPSTKKAFVF